MISIIINSINPQRTQAIRQQFQKALGPAEHEIIIIPDAKSMCEGYNRGLKLSRGDPVIFSHDDLEILTPPELFRARLASHLQSFDVIGIAGADRLIGLKWVEAGPPHIFGQVLEPNPHKQYPLPYLLTQFGIPAPVVPNIQILDGVFLAFRRPVIETLAWDAQTFRHFHFYDLDTTFRAHRAGYKIAVACDIQLFHASSGRKSETWHQSAAAFLTKHAGQLAPPPYGAPPLFHTCEVLMPSKPAALQAMTPAYWNLR